MWKSVVAAGFLAGCISGCGALLAEPDGDD